MWLQELSSCSCLTVLPGSAWVLLSKTYKPLLCLCTAYLCLKHWCIGSLKKLVVFQYCAILCTKENDCVGTKIVSGMCQLYKEASTILSLDSGIGASPLYMMCVS